MSRGKNCLPIVSRQFLTRNYPRPNCLLKCLPNCLSPTREGILSSFKINPAVRVIARQVRDKNCLAAIFAPRHQSVSSGPLGRLGYTRKIFGINCVIPAGSMVPTRKKMVDIMTEGASKVLLRDLVKKLIPEALGKEIEKQAQSIYPLKDCCIRKVLLLLLLSSFFDAETTILVKFAFSSGLGKGVENLGKMSKNAIFFLAKTSEDKMRKVCEFDCQKFDCHFSGQVRPRQGTEICNYGASSPLEALHWIFCFFFPSPVLMSNLVRRAP